MKTRRNVFDLSHERKFTMNMGALTPIFCKEVVPGDTFSVNTEIFLRCMPLMAPVMHRINCYVHYYFVPYRLVWNNWEKFITGVDPDIPLGPHSLGNIVNLKIPFVKTIYGEQSGTSPNYTYTYDNKTLPGQLLDYMGVGTIPSHVCFMNGYGQAITDPKKMQAPFGCVNVLPLRAYQMIWNEWYRDEDLQDPVAINKGDTVPEPSPDQNAAWQELFKFRFRNWEKDYYTTARPWTQKGPEVSLLLDKVMDVSDRTKDPVPATGSRELSHLNDVLMLGATGEPQRHAAALSGMSINDLRAAFQVQKWMERSARGGSRYIEAILAHFGVKSSDARLQRPEFLGGNKAHVVMSEVLQTAPSDTSDAKRYKSGIGSMAGHGIAHGHAGGFKRFFEEHGVVLGLMSIVPRAGYMDTTDKQWFRRTKFDYYWPEFAHLGEEPIYKAQVPFCFRRNAVDPNLPLNLPNYADQPSAFMYYQNYGAEFGYTGRWNDMRYIPSTAHGDMKRTLKFWHMDRDMTEGAGRSDAWVGEFPALSSAFVSIGNVKDLYRTFQYVSNDEDHFVVQLYNKVHAIRPMPFVSDPGLIDHF